MQKRSKVLNAARRLTEILKQPQYSPLAIWEQAATLLAANEGAFDTVPVEKIKEAQKNLLSNLHAQHKKEMAELDKGDQKVEGKIHDLILKLANAVASDFNEVVSQES
jgi:F-type H+-transporting ATPase subunit alpha